MEKERSKWTEMLDKAMDKTVIVVMDRQRVEIMGQEENLDDLQQITTKRDEIIYEQLSDSMTQMKMVKADDICDIVIQASENRKITTINNLFKKDVDDGQPTAWAEAAYKGD